MKKGVKMVDMSIHDVSGVVGWCLGAYSEVEKTCVHHLHTFLHTGSGLYNPLQHPRIVSRPHILYNISTTLYNTLQSTALQQFYSLQPLHLPSGEPPAARPRARPPQRSRRHWFEMQDPNSVQVTRVADAGPATHSVHVGPGVQNPSVTQ